MKNKYSVVTMADNERINEPCKSCPSVKIVYEDKIRKFGCGALGGSFLMEYRNTYSQLINCPKRENKIKKL